MPVIDMPLLGYGTFPLKGEEAITCTLMALELGYRHLDTAQMYGNEAEVGRAMTESGLHRDDVFLTTKVKPDNYDDNSFAPSVRQSLEKLDVDQVDLLLLHWPHPSLEMEAVLDRLVAAKEAQKQAASVGGEWRDTGKMIKKAEALLKEGKAEEAAKMAEAAEAQGMLGYMQATSQTADNLHI